MGSSQKMWVFLQDILWVLLVYNVGLKTTISNQIVPYIFLNLYIQIFQIFIFLKVTLETTTMDKAIP